MDYTQEQLDEKYKTLPQDLKDAIDSVEIGDLVAKIGDENNLMLDQSAELMDQTALVMLGIISSEEFSNNLVKKLQISDDKANVIGAEINDKIFNKIRESLQKIQAQAESEPSEESTYTTPPSNLPSSTISSIEQAGNFTIDQQPSSSSDQYKDTNINKEATLKGIEDQPIPMVDHLLTTPVSTPEQIEVKKVIENKPYTADPYREEV